MEKWEYKKFSINTDEFKEKEKHYDMQFYLNQIKGNAREKAEEECLKEIGEAGWELVSCDGIVFYFKRRKAD